MRRKTKTTAPRRASISFRMSAWIGRRQGELSDRVHAVGDEHARQYGWEITKSTGRFGFGARSYRDHRFGDRRRGGMLRILGRWVARPDNQGSPETQPEVIPALELDQKQANVVLARWRTPPRYGGRQSATAPTAGQQTTVSAPSTRAAGRPRRSTTGCAGISTTPAATASQTTMPKWPPTARQLSTSNP